MYRIHTKYAPQKELLSTVLIRRLFSPFLLIRVKLPPSQSFPGTVDGAVNNFSHADDGEAAEETQRSSDIRHLLEYTGELLYYCGLSLPCDIIHTTVFQNGIEDKISNQNQPPSSSLKGKHLPNFVLNICYPLLKVS